MEYIDENTLIDPFFFSFIHFFFVLVKVIPDYFHSYHNTKKYFNFSTTKESQ